MTNQELEARLKKALEAQAPNDLEAVLSRCGQQEGSVVTMKKRNNRIFAAAAAAAACLALALGVGYSVNNKVASLVSLDVNPSIQLDLNKKDRVVKADALNADAKAVMDGMDLKGVPAEVAVNALIGSMVKNGYVSQDANSILISVQNKDPEAAAALRERLDAAASQSMQQDDVQGAVISQVVTGSEELTKKASEYGISAGRVQFIEELTKENETLDFEQLAARPVNDLTLLASSSKNATAHTSGTVSEGKYVGRDTAQNAALQHAGVSAANASMVSTEFDMEDGKMVYEVEFYAGNEKFECDVDAITGKVLKMEKKAAGADVSKLIGENKAQDAAIAHAGVTPDAGTLKTDLDNENGRPVYEVEFVSGGIEYEYKLDAATGAVLKADNEAAGMDVSKLIGKNKAQDAAIAHAGVTPDAGTLKADLDNENGKAVYEVEFVSGGIEYEYKLDATTGAVLKAEKDKQDPLDDLDDLDDLQENVNKPAPTSKPAQAAKPQTQQKQDIQNVVEALKNQGNQVDDDDLEDILEDLYEQDDDDDDDDEDDD